MAMGEEICCLHLIDLCTADALCDKVHSRTPYLWQSWSENQWSPLPDNEQIEQDYCNPAKTKHVGMLPLYFDTMTYGSAQVRRLSICTSATDSLSSLATKWVWYWEKSEDKWIEFGSPAYNRSSSIDSDELERQYLNGETMVTFTAGRHQYELRFLDMFQTNTHDKTQRLVRRRPGFISKTDTKKACEIYRSKAPPIIPISLPHYWDPHALTNTGYERIKLDTASSEYSEVFNMFNKTMRGHEVLSIERIQNLPLWKFFNLQADQMRKKNSGNINEQILYYGIKSKDIAAICKQNLDWRICEPHGTRYGRGSYFTRDASASHRFTDLLPTTFMFACRVLVGEYTKGRPNYVRPPSKKDSSNLLYDSCVNNVDNPTIFVVFDKHQVYPEYLIQYSSIYSNVASIYSDLNPYCGASTGPGPIAEIEETGKDVSDNDEKININALLAKALLSCEDFTARTTPQIPLSQDSIDDKDISAEWTSHSDISMVTQTSASGLDAPNDFQRPSSWSTEEVQRSRSVTMGVTMSTLCPSPVSKPIKSSTESPQCSSPKPEHVPSSWVVSDSITQSSVSYGNSENTLQPSSADGQTQRVSALINYFQELAEQK